VRVRRFRGHDQRWQRIFINHQWHESAALVNYFSDKLWTFRGVIVPEPAIPNSPLGIIPIGKQSTFPQRKYGLPRPAILQMPRIMLTSLQFFDMKNGSGGLD
jgi:hypothetical protein